MKKLDNRKLCSKLLLIGLIVFMGVFLIDFSSAFEFDNVKSYNEELKVVTITNSFGFGKEIGKAKLLTPLVYQVREGYNKIAEIEIEGFEDYKEFISEMDSYDAKKGMKEIDKTYDYKIKKIIEIKYEAKYCEKEYLENGSICKDLGERIIKEESWEILGNTEINFSKKNIIGIFTNVGHEETTEWIPKIGGKKINEWAVFTSSALVTTDGDYTVLTYLNNGTFNTTLPINNVSILIIGGGGGGGSATTCAGGGGGGGYYNISNYNISTGNYNIIIGNGGTTGTVGGNGGNSSFDTLVGIGGGGGGSCGLGASDNGKVGGSGGGGGANSGTGAIGLQGFNGGNGLASNGGGGGGGAGGNALSASAGEKGGNGGNGTQNNINGSNIYYAGGGGGGGISIAGTGGLGGGGTYGVNANGINSLGGGGGATGVGGSGVVIIRYLSLNQFPEITINSPTSTNYTTSPQSLTINFTASDDINLSNVTLWVNEVLNQTNSSGINNSIYLFPLTLGDGDYTIFGKATDNVSQSTNSSSIRIFIDSSKPQFTINYGSGLQNYSKVGNNHTINITINDTNLHTCWYNYNSTNTTFSCSTGVLNSLIFNLYQNNNSVNFYANDSVGNINSTIVNWDYKVFENSRTYSSTTTSGAGEQFKTNITYNPYYSGISVFLNYNGTNYTMSSLDSGFTKEYYYNLTIPSVTSARNITTYFIYLVSNTTDSATMTSDSFNQTVNPFLIDDCSSYNQTLLDFYMVDEDTLEEINGTIEVNINIYSYGTTDLVNSYNTSFNYLTTTDSKICLQNITQDYTMSYQIKHYGNIDQYFQKYRNIQRMTINGETVPQNITLYNLNLSRGYAFSVIIVGNLLSSVGNRGLLVDAQRQYLSLDEFKSIETSITNADGTAVSHLVPTSEIYNFIVSYNGEVLGTFNNYQVQCSNAPLGQCSITLNLAQATGTAPDFENYGNISQIFLLNQDTHILYNTFSSTDGTSKTIRSLVIKLDGYGNTTICNSSSTGTSGTLTCEIPVIYQNSTFYVQTFVDGDLLGTKTFSQGVDQEWYGVDTIIILLAFSSFVLLFVGHPVTIVLGAVLGLIFPVILVSIAGLSFITIMGSLLYWVAGGVLIWIVIRRKM